MLMILANCVTLGVYKPCEDVQQAHTSCDSIKCWILSIFDHSIFIFFASEMVIRMIAMGFKAYFAEIWNRLDALIIAAGYAQ